MTVADTGYGVTQELKERLVLPYFSTKKRGTGLGLAIVTRIIEDLHGSIRVGENQPVGARFVVELPLAPESLTVPARDRSEEHTSELQSRENLVCRLLLEKKKK